MELKELKAGDEVAICFGSLSKRYEIATVEKVTPTGRIKVRGDYYNTNGYQIGGSYNAPSIEVVTEEIRGGMAHRNLLHKLEKVLEAEPLKRRSLETLRAVAAALGVAE